MKYRELRRQGMKAGAGKYPEEFNERLPDFGYGRESATKCPAGRQQKTA